MIDLNVKEYVKVTSLEEAYELLTCDPLNQIIGGGAWMKMSTNKEINTLIDLGDLDLQYITSDKEAFHIGAYATLHDIEVFEELCEYYDGILIKAIKEIMGMGIRNLATIGGSVMGKYAFSDLFGVLLALDATLVFYQQKEMSIREFLETKKVKEDILLEIVIPKRHARGFFKKVKRTALDFAIINICVLKGDDFEIVVGARPSIAKRAVKTSAFLKGKKSTDEVLEEAMKILEDELSFSDNIRGSKEYRLDLVKVYVKRGIKEVVSS
ncbi:MAG: FAD binding domain-containing protein [Candidatus Izemoplasmataceae bacterium]